MLPSNAKLVFKDALFEVWQWEQKMFDGSVKIFEKVKRPDTVEIIATVGDKIVIEEQEQPGGKPFLCVPCGRVEENGEIPRRARSPAVILSPDATIGVNSVKGSRASALARDDMLLTEAKRELLEETGYASEDWQLWKQISPQIKIIYTIHFFIARNCQKIAEQKLDAGERIKTQLVTFDEFLALSDNPRFYNSNSELVKMLLRMRLHPEEREEFFRLLFPSP